MPLSPRTLVAALACALVAMTACSSSDGGSAEAAGTVRVLDATVDAPANPDVAAVRLVVDNQGATADSLRSVDSPVAEAVSIHRSGEDAEGRAVMDEVTAVPIAARSTVRFDPGGLHVMLTGLRRPLEVGDAVPLTFTFRDAGTRTVRARVVEPGTAGEHGHAG